MCLLFMYINDDESKDGYRLIIADNRDEEWDRPTKPLSFWSDCPDCISGQDQTEGKEGGTWIGASKKGRIGILLNILGRNDPQKIGRGHLVNGFICSQKTAEDFIKEKISPCVGGFNSFNLILLDLSLLKTEGVWCTHYEDKMTIKHIHGGITTCDNSEPGIPWQKSIQNRERFEEIIKQYNHKDKKDKLVEELLNLLGDRTLISDDEKIYNQGRMAGRPDDYLLQLSAPFVWAPKYRYGTSKMEKKRQETNAGNTFLWLIAKQLDRVESRIYSLQQRDRETEKAIDELDSRLKPFESGHKSTQNNTDISALLSSLQNEQNKILETLEKIRVKQETFEDKFMESKNGGTYIRWGRNNCQMKSTLVYNGYAAGRIVESGGSGSNYLCLPKYPQWGRYSPGYDSSTGRIGGVEYEMTFIKHNHPYNKYYNNKDMPCAVCETKNRPTVLMIPARTKCFSNWHQEYTGYLMSEAHASPSSRSTSEYICVDRDLEIVPGGDADNNHGVAYPVEVLCGSLKCPPYVAGRELTCVVCSK